MHKGKQSTEVGSHFKVKVERVNLSFGLFTTSRVYGTKPHRSAGSGQVQSTINN